MSKELATQPQSRPSALGVMASRFNVEPQKLLSTLKNTVFKNATDDELLALVVVANEYGLNPLTKEIYAFPAKGGGIVPVISIDGWINRMNSNAQFDGIEFAEVFGEDKKPVSVTASIFRKDRSRAIKVTEYYAECRRNTEPWNTMPSRMLRHKALCQCVRVAFGFGGVYDEDEARDLMIRDVTPKRTATGPDLANLPRASETPQVQGNKQAEDVTQEPALADFSLTPEHEVQAEILVDTKTGKDEPSTRDTLRDMMESDGITLTDLRGVCAKSKLAPSNFTRLADIPDALAKTLVDSWPEVKTHAGK